MHRNQTGNREMSNDEAQIVLHCVYTTIEIFKHNRNLCDKENDKYRYALFERVITDAQKIALALE